MKNTTNRQRRPKPYRSRRRSDTEQSPLHGILSYGDAVLKFASSLAIIALTYLAMQENKRANLISETELKPEFDVISHMRVRGQPDSGLAERYDIVVRFAGGKGRILDVNTITKYAIVSLVRSDDPKTVQDDCEFHARDAYWESISDEKGIKLSDAGVDDSLDWVMEHLRSQGYVDQYALVKSDTIVDIYYKDAFGRLSHEYYKGRSGKFQPTQKSSYSKWHDQSEIIAQVTHWYSVPMSGLEMIKGAKDNSCGINFSWSPDKGHEPTLSNFGKPTLAWTDGDPTH